MHEPIVFDRYGRPIHWAMIGQAPPVPEQPVQPQPQPAPQDQGFRGALMQVTPTLLVVGVATGAAFAIGSGLVSRYLFHGR